MGNPVTSTEETIPLWTHEVVLTRAEQPRTVRADLLDGAIVFDPDRLTQTDLALFQAYCRGHIVSLEATQAGRGQVAFVRGSFGEGVLRHYRRGGLIARWTADRYFYCGAERTRAFREFHLLQALRGRGLPVPRPLAAAFYRSGAFYRADLLTERIAPARTLAEMLPTTLGNTSLWEQIGKTLARFHAQGVFHADLNAHNLLIGDNGQLWLLDFDRGALRPPALSWQQANLARLERSLIKLGVGSLEQWANSRATLLRGYRQTLKEHP